MSDKFRDDDDDDQLTRRRVLGAAAAATGIAAFAGSRISRSRVDNGEPTPSPNATATNSPVSSTPFVEASQESLASGTAIVTENGVDLSVGPVHVSAPAGVAAAGTGITVALGKHVPQGDVASLAAMIGDSADITLDGGIQPEQPLTVTFSLAGSPLASGVSDETPLMVLSWSESEEMYSLIEASWDAERETLTATVDHLSLHWPFKIDLQGIINGIVADLMGFRFPYPDCAYNPLTMGAATYTVAAIDDTSVWPCIEERNGEVVLSLHSNSILPWSIETTPSSRATITASFGDLSPALVGVYSGLYGLIGESRSAILPGNVATFTFAQNQPPTMARLVLEPGLFLITILVWAIRSLLEILLRGRAEAIADAMGQLDCLVDVINTTQEVTDELYFTGVINTAIICIKEAIVEEGGNWVAKAVTRTALAVVALVAGGAGLLAAAVLGIIKTVTSTDRITFQITSSLPAGQPEPSTVASGEGVLMYRGDTARSGHMPGPGPSLEKPIVVRWRTSSAGWIRSQPAILGDTLYAGNSDGQLCAVDSRSGTVLWRYRTDDSISATPAIANGVLYMGSRDHNLYAIDLETRAELWTFSTTGPVDSAPTARDGVVYVGSGDASVYAIGAASGEERWTFGTGAAVKSSPAVVDGTIYIGSDDNHLYAIDATSGEQRWKFATGAGISSAPAVMDNVVYTTSGDGNLYALDATTGERRWVFSAGDGMYASPAIADGVIYAGSDDRNLYAIDTETGSEIWQFTAGFWIQQSPVVANGVVYIGSGDYNFYAIDAATGTELWRFGTGDHVISSAAVHNSVVYVSSANDTLFALGNPQMAVLLEDVTLRGAPAFSGVERGSAIAGTEIERLGASTDNRGQRWIEVTIQGVTGWIPFNAIDPASIPSGDDPEYIYRP